MTSPLSFSLVWSFVVVSLRGSRDDSSAYPTCLLSVTQTDNLLSRQAVTLLQPGWYFLENQVRMYIQAQAPHFLVSPPLSISHHREKDEFCHVEAIAKDCQRFIVAPKSFIEVLCWCWVISRKIVVLFDWTRFDVFELSVPRWHIVQLAEEPVDNAVLLYNLWNSLIIFLSNCYRSVVSNLSLYS